MDTFLQYLNKRIAYLQNQCDEYDDDEELTDFLLQEVAMEEGRLKEAIHIRNKLSKLKKLETEANTQ